MWKEFKEFAFKGNVIDMAVGVIIGGAFQKIVTSVINDLIMPFVSLVTGSIDFAQNYVVLKYPDGVKATYESLTLAKEAGATVFAYGSFITAVVDFIIMALVIFFMVKAINKIKTVGEKKKEEAVVEEVVVEEPKPTEIELLTDIRDLLLKQKEN